MKKRDWNSFRGVPCTLIPHGHEGTAGLCQLESRDFERWSGEKEAVPSTTTQVAGYFQLASEIWYAPWF